jgi:hypothetical protein
VKALRHDGLYQSSDQLDVLDMAWYWFYLWFGSAGEVVLISHCGPPEKAAACLRNGEQIARGNYWVDGERVRGRIEESGINFEATVIDDGLELRSDDGIGYFPPSDTFRFVPVAVGEGIGPT